METAEKCFQKVAVNQFLQKIEVELEAVDFEKELCYLHYSTENWVQRIKGGCKICEVATARNQF